MQVKLSIIDIDSMFYHSSGRDSLEECMMVFREKLQNCLSKTECSHWAGFTSRGKTFRHSVFNGYKANRTQPPPKYLSALKEWAITEFNLNTHSGVESDDLCAYWMNQDLCIDGDSERIETRNMFESALMLCKEDGFPEFTFNSIEKVLCAVDKDLLQSIPGKNYNYTYKLEEKGNINSLVKGWFIETSIEDSINFRGKQLLMGDSTDGINGLSGIGEAKANKILKNWIDGNIETFILNYYIDYYKGDVSTAIFEFQKNYRLLHMLNCDQDFIREVGSIPLLQGIQEVPKKPVSITNQF